MQDEPRPVSFGFVLSQTDNQPMYAQLMEQVKERVAVGDWSAGSELPSIRELAVALNISTITVKRAYLELEREGVIVTQQGRGSWVAESADPILIGREKLERQLDRLVDLALVVGLSGGELIELLATRARLKLGP